MLACVKGDVERVQELLVKWSKNHNINETDPVSAREVLSATM